MVDYLLFAQTSNTAGTGNDNDAVFWWVQIAAIKILKTEIFVVFFIGMKTFASIRFL